MRGSIKFSTGRVVHFDDSNYHEVINSLTKEQIQQLKSLIFKRMGPSPENEYGVDEEVYQVWLDLTHRDDIKRGGGGRNGEPIDKRSSKKLTRKWQSKSDAELNITWLLRNGFKPRWNKNSGYTYRHPVWGTVPLDWIISLNPHEFQERVQEMMEYGHPKKT